MLCRVREAFSCYSFLSHFNTIVFINLCFELLNNNFVHARQSYFVDSLIFSLNWLNCSLHATDLKLFSLCQIRLSNEVWGESKFKS